jgi:hypothetical protein
MQQAPHWLRQFIGEFYAQPPEPAVAREDTSSECRRLLR